MYMRPDIAYAVIQVAGVRHNPKKSHVRAVKISLDILQDIRAKEPFINDLKNCI